MSGERVDVNENGLKYKKKDKMSWDAVQKNILSTIKAVSKLCVETPLIAAALVIAATMILVSAGVVFITMHDRSRRSVRHSDNEMLRRAGQEMDRWAAGKGLPTFGVTHGNYLRNGKFCHNCGSKFRWCRGRTTNTTLPPRELLLPGRLSERDISDTAGCFLWCAHQLLLLFSFLRCCLYSALLIVSRVSCRYWSVSYKQAYVALGRYAHLLYSRPAGGAAGISTLRMGGGVDNRTRFLEALGRSAPHPQPLLSTPRRTAPRSPHAHPALGVYDRDRRWKSTAAAAASRPHPCAPLYACRHPSAAPRCALEPRRGARRFRTRTPRGQRLPPCARAPQSPRTAARGGGGRYEARHGCRPFQMVPVTLDLSDPASCPLLLVPPPRAAAAAAAAAGPPPGLGEIVWFVKAAEGCGRGAEGGRCRSVFGWWRARPAAGDVAFPAREGASAGILTHRHLRNIAICGR